MVRSKSTNPASKVFAFFEWTRVFRRVFGFIHGIQIAWKIRSATWAASPGQLMEISIPGWRFPIYLRARTSDSEVFCQVFLDRQGFFPTSLVSPKFVIDAGANIGLMSVCFANRFPESKIIALEVERENYELLVKNCQPYSNVIPMHLGLWSHSASLSIGNPDGDAWSFQVQEATAGTLGAIKAIGISDLLEMYENPLIDILKIDVEGSEYEVFATGLDKWIDRVSVIVVEIHDRIRPGATDLVIKSLANSGFCSSRFGDWWIFARKSINGSNVVDEIGKTASEEVVNPPPGKQG